MKHYLWWIPLVIFGSAFLTRFSIANNEQKTLGSALRVYFVTILCISPLWPLVSRVSKNILFDGMLFDNLLFLAFAVAMVCLGQAVHFGPLQWVGLGAVVTGSVLMRV